MLHLQMLPVDMALDWDAGYKQWLRHYDRHRREFRTDAAKVWQKLTELGCEGILTQEDDAPPLG